MSRIRSWIRIHYQRYGQRIRIRTKMSRIPNTVNPDSHGNDLDPL
jgi:hypothetical protein